ncbi:MAG: aspartate kinase [Planctomycetes bacterium]|nr:aspartate kinase [Planctomycetota bacterium]
MSTIVMKFGGSSLADPEKIRAAARRAIAAKRKGNKVAMVVSAMGDTTDHLETLAFATAQQPHKREWDQLMATGEQVTIALTAMALHDMGENAISFTAAQIGMVTDDVHTKARLKRINARRILSELDAGKIVIIAGFQGVTEAGDVTTLGRGGSNVTLVAIAAAIGADVCENYTDVDGVYTADPRIVPNARKLDTVSYDEMLELASLGANVLHNRAVEFAKKYDVPIHVRSSLNNRKGTMIVAENPAMENIVVRGAALKEKLARITLKNVPDKPGVAASLFHGLAKAGIVVDDIVQTLDENKKATVSFTIEMRDMPDAETVCKGLIASSLKGADLSHVADLAKISVVGVGMRVHTGVAERMFGALAEAKVNIQNITTSEIKISCIIDSADGKTALRIVHDAFNLGGRPAAAGKATKKTPKAGK